MKPSTFLAASILAVSSLASAAINVTYDTGAWEHDSSHSEVRVKWETDELMDLSLSLIKQEQNTHKWPLGHSLVATRWMKLRLPAGHAEFMFWDIPKVDAKGKYAFYMEGYDTEDERYGETLLDKGYTEWLDIRKE